MVFKNREHAGQLLANKLQRYKGTHTIVAGLPRGGMIVAAEVSRRLECPLDVVLVKKISHPHSPEFAIGAVVDGHPALYSAPSGPELHESLILHAENAARKILGERSRLYQSHTRNSPFAGKTLLLIDDGMATGTTMHAAIQGVKSYRPRKIVAAVPVASPESVQLVKKSVQELIVLENPQSFSGAVGGHYMDFSEITDEKVLKTMKEVNSNVHKDFANKE